MLVVVVIIGIVIAGAILSLGATGRDSQLEQESNRLTALIAYVRDRGALMNTEYGILCGQHGYRFVFFDPRTMQWQPETLDDTLRPRRLPAGLTLQLVVEGRPVDLSDQALTVNQDAANAEALPAGAPASALTGSALSGAGTASAAAGDAGSTGNPGSGLGAPTDLNDNVTTNAPQIMLLSNGDTNSFSLRIERPSARRSVTLQSAGDGTISTGQIVQATE